MSNELGLITEPTIASERLFRVGIANKLITFAGDVVVIVALYALTPNDSKPSVTEHLVKLIVSAKGARPNAITRA